MTDTARTAPSDDRLNKIAARFEGLAEDPEPSGPQGRKGYENPLNVSPGMDAGEVLMSALRRQFSERMSAKDLAGMELNDSEDGRSASISIPQEGLSLTVSRDPAHPGEYLVAFDGGVKSAEMGVVAASLSVAVERQTFGARDYAPTAVVQNLERIQLSTADIKAPRSNERAEPELLAQRLVARGLESLQSQRLAREVAERGLAPKAMAQLINRDDKPSSRHYHSAANGGLPTIALTAMPSAGEFELIGRLLAKDNAYALVQLGNTRAVCVVDLDNAAGLDTFKEGAYVKLTRPEMAGGRYPVARVGEVHREYAQERWDQKLAGAVMSSLQVAHTQHESYAKQNNGQAMGFAEFCKDRIQRPSGAQALTAEFDRAALSMAGASGLEKGKTLSAMRKELSVPGLGKQVERQAALSL